MSTPTAELVPHLRSIAKMMLTGETMFLGCAGTCQDAAEKLEALEEELRLTKLVLGCVLSFSTAAMSDFEEELIDERRRAYHQAGNALHAFQEEQAQREQGASAPPP